MAKKTIICLLLCVLLAGFGYNFYRHMLMEPYRKGVSAFKEGNFAEALKQMEPLAQKGNLRARQLMARIYALGLGVEVDNDVAKKWLSCTGIKSCVNGKAEYYLALLFFEKGNNLFDREKATYWMEISSDKGYRKADEWLAGVNGSE